MPLPPDDSGLAPSDLTTLCAFPGYSTTFNVKSAPYSAVGDGVADDTAAIETAIAAAIAGGGHAFIYFPAGTYAVCRQTDTHTSALYQPIFDLTSADTKDPSNLCFIGDGPTLSKIVGYMPSLGDPVTAYQTSTLGSPNPQVSRFVMFYTGFVVHWSNLQFRSLTIDGQAGYTGDFTVGGSRKLVTVTPATAGTGYHVGDILNPVPTGGFPLIVGFETDIARIRVTSINGGGGVTGVALDYGGRYGYISGGTIDVTGGFGTGFQFTFTSTITGDGWDQLHKAFFFFEGTGILIYNCDLKNWRGEIIYGGSNQTLSTVLTDVHGTNSSAISIGANLLVSDCVIGGDGTSDTNLVYNGTENDAVEAGQQTIVQRTSTRTGGGLGNGFVHAGISGSLLTVDDDDIYQRLLISGEAFNVLIENSRFHGAGIESSFPDATGFHNFTFNNNTVTGSGSTLYLWAGATGVSDGLAITNNTLTGSSLYLCGGDIFQPGAVITGNTLLSGAVDIPDSFGSTKVALWSGNLHPSGIGSIGYRLNTSGNGDTSTIFPVTDYTALQSGNTNQHYIEIDDTQLSKYPDGFLTHFRRSATNLNFTLKKNTAWNAFGSDVDITYDDLCIRLNGSRKFEVVVLPLAAGTVSTSSVGGVSASISYGIVTEGVTPYSSQLQRSLTSGSGFSNVGSPQAGSSFSVNDSGLSLSTNYYYRVVTTDNASTAVTSAELHIKTGSSAVDLLTGLAAYYKCDESSGNLADSTGNGHTLTNTNTGTFSAGKINNGFNVTDAVLEQYAVDTGHSIMSGAKTKISLSGFFKRDDHTNKKGWIGYSDDLTKFFGLLVNSDSSLYAFVGDANTIFQTFTDTTDGAFFHYVMVYDGTQSAGSRLAVYRNGSVLSVASSGGTIPASYTINGDFRIGKESGGSGLFRGSYDEWAVYDGVALDASQVAALYASGAGVQWPFSTPTAGTLAQTAVTATTASLSYGTVADGLAPYSNQLQRSLVSGSGYSNVGSPQVGATASFSDTGLTASTDYYYVVVTTDNASQTATSNEVHVTTSAAAVAAGRQSVHIGIGISI